MEPEPIPQPTAMRPFVCALCGFPQRSVYSLPGETQAKLCSGCFFREPIAKEKE